MFIDKQTLSDLDIFKAGEAGLTVFDFIDKTKTAGGKFRLREKLLYPPENIKKLKLQQNAIRFFTQNYNRFILPFSSQQIKSLEAYLSSNIEIIKSERFFECLQFYLSDIQAYRELKTGIKEITSFIFVFQSFFGINKKDELPELLKSISNEISSFINNYDFQNITKVFNNKGLYFFEVLKSDRILRAELKTNLKNIVAFYYEIDSLLSMAKTNIENNFQFPEFAEDETCLFQAEELYHPLLKKAMPCNVEINKDSNFIFLTGPNMAGKTTFLKAAGISVYLAHIGMGVPAKSARMSYFDSLFTSINVPDNVLKGYSYFFSEVKRVKQLAELLNNGENVFALFDELFKGTNLKDAYDASSMVISGLVQWKNSTVILSSHLWELWVNIRSFQNARSFYFESEIKNGTPVFTYSLKSGVSDMRLGMTIIKNEKIMDLLNK